MGTTTRTNPTATKKSTTKKSINKTTKKPTNKTTSKNINTRFRLNNLPHGIRTNINKMLSSNNKTTLKYVSKTTKNNNNKTKAPVNFKIVNPKSKFVLVSYWWGRGVVNKNTIRYYDVAGDELEIFAEDEVAIVSNIKKQMGGFTKEKVLKYFKDDMIPASIQKKYINSGITIKPNEIKTYEELKDRLIRDCVVNGVNYYFVEIPKFAKPGKYQEGINYKPEFILDALTFVNKRGNYGVFYIDSDMRVAKYPHLCDLDIDFGGYNWFGEVRDTMNIHDTRYSKNLVMCSGGSMFFSNSWQAKRLLQDWIAISKSHTTAADDRLLSMMVTKAMVMVEMKVYWFPLEYLWLDDKYNAKRHKSKFGFGHLINNHFGNKRQISRQEYIGIKKKDIVVYHPEKLTSEEMALDESKSTNNRVPAIWYTYTGRKARWESIDKKNPFVDIKSFYMNKHQIEHARVRDKYINDIGFEKVVKTVSCPKSCKVSKHKVVKPVTGPYVMFSIGTKIPKVNVIVAGDPDNKRDIVNAFYTVMKAYPSKSVVYIHPEYKINSTPSMFHIPNIDFMAVNIFAHPVYNKFTKGVNKFYHDPRTLQLLNPNVMFMANTPIMKNYLKLVLNTSGTATDAFSLAFNKYNMLYTTRCMWLPPTYGFYEKHRSLYTMAKINKAVIISTNITPKLLPVNLNNPYFRRLQGGYAENLDEYGNLTKYHQDLYNHEYENLFENGKMKNMNNTRSIKQRATKTRKLITPENKDRKKAFKQLLNPNIITNIRFNQPTKQNKQRAKLFRELPNMNTTNIMPVGRPVNKTL